MAERDVWILGASMTKFGRYPDKDLIDLGARGGARRPRRRRRHDGRHGRHGRRQPHRGRAAASASASRSRSARPASPSTTSPTRARPAPPRCAACTWRSRRARPTWGSPSAWRRWARRACSAARPARDKKVFEPSGRYGSVMSVEGRVGTTLMPGVFAQAGMEYAQRARRRRLRAVRQGRREEPRALDAEPARAVPEAVLARRGHGRRDDGVPEHAADVLPDRRRRAPRWCWCRRRSCATLSDDQRKRAVKISASVMTSDPWTETDQVQPDVNTLTRDAANQAYETAGVDPQDLDLVELHDCFATAELIHYDNLGLCEPGEAGKFIDERGPWRDGETPGQRVAAASSRRATRSARPASPTSTRSRRTCGARPATARSRAPRSG